MKICLCLILLLWLTACTPQTTQIQDSPAPTHIEESALATPILPTPEPVQEMLTDVIVMDLSKRIPIESDAIRVISVETDSWPDSGLGCPLSDQVYIQGSVSGYRVRLDAEGQIYEYHIVDDGKHFTLCQTTSPVDAPIPTLPGKPGSDTDTTPWVPVN